jgi:hypothetical protein
LGILKHHRSRDLEQLQWCIRIPNIISQYFTSSIRLLIKILIRRLTEADDVTTQGCLLGLLVGLATEDDNSCLALAADKQLITLAIGFLKLPKLHVHQNAIALLTSLIEESELVAQLLLESIGKSTVFDQTV